MFRKIVTVMLCLFMVAGSIIPQNYEKVYASSTYEAETAETTVESADYDSTDDIDLTQINILGEVVSERTSTSKTFKKVDGTYEIAIYDDVIHYYENGEWIQ
ncbi:MAG: hypothetical protein PHZ28_05705, partial [Candidatus Izemoplasmatales bacterium]|nr:hypothetical protein [Candidatus Izemoplasmatales bacterium]